MNRILLLLVLLPISLLSQTTRTLVLNWTASTTPNVTYNVFRGATSAGPFTQLNSVGISGLSFSDNITVGQTYTYYVVAYAGPCSLTGVVTCGSSVPSNGISVTVPPAPAAVTAITITIP